MNQDHQQQSTTDEVLTTAAKVSGMSPEDFSELIIGGLEGWCSAIVESNAPEIVVGAQRTPRG